jgi:predicted flap endonuclease-1-like 5' DNA nuclease
MEELLAILIGAFAVLASPLVPAFRPVAKAAVKGSLVLTDAVAGVAAVASHQWSQVIPNASQKNMAAAVPAVMTVAEPTEAPAPPVAPAVAETTVAEPVVAKEARVRKPALVGVANKTGAAAGFSELTRVDGIGPKVAELISKSGATTLAQLAAMNTEQLREILISAGPRYQGMDPTSWPEQARQLSESAPVAVADKPGAAVRVSELTRVDGIGPKVAELLEKTGVTTLEQLAAMNGEQLREILAGAAARYRGMDPTSWPDQARRMVESAQ